MSNESESGEDILSPIEMRHWLAQETGDVLKGAELRVKDATDFVTRYATGEITANDAMTRFKQYNARWYEAIPGLAVPPAMSNEEIIRRLDDRILVSRVTPGRGR